MSLYVKGMTAVEVEERDVTQKDVKCLRGFGTVKKFGNNKLNVDIFTKSSVGWFVTKARQLESRAEKYGCD